MYNEKVVKDLVYGYITLDEDVQEIIDHRSFQRLKDVAQLTAHHLYPSANHTRFEHSLGVMHLVNRIFDEQICQVLQDKFKNFNAKSERLHLLYAALLHDVGHAPLSHVGENFFDVNEISTKLCKICGSDVMDSIKSGSKHEQMSCYVIAKNFYDPLKKIFEKNGVVLEVKYLFRIITGTKYSPNPRNIVIEILNSDSVDADKIDYLLRDNKMCGIVAPQFDLERLIRSISIDKSKRIAFKYSGISSISNLIDCRDYLYIWVYNHHVVVYTDFLYTTILEHLSNKDNNISKQKITLSDYFSCDAITDRYVSDSDVLVLIKNEYNDICQGRSQSKYSTIILEQLLERKFLKPTWKTLFSFNQFINSSNNFDARQASAIINRMNSESVRVNELVNMLIKSIKADKGEVLVIKRSNKFYTMSSKKEFYIVDGNGNSEELGRIMPLRNFSESHANIVFYVFAKESKLDRVRAILPTEICKWMEG